MSRSQRRLTTFTQPQKKKEVITAIFAVNPEKIVGNIKLKLSIIADSSAAGK